MHFWKSYICSNNLDVQETNFSFAQFRIRNHFFGCRIGLDGFPALDLWDLIVSVLGNTAQTHERPGRPVVNDKNQRSQGMTNMLNSIDCVPQTSSLRTKKLCCMCLRTTKQ